MNNRELKGREELLSRIQQITQRIELGASSLNLGGQQAEVFARNLDLIKKKASDTSASLAQLQRSLLGVASAVESGSTGRANLGNINIGISELSRAYEAGSKQVTAVGSPYTPTTTTSPIIPQGLVKVGNTYMTPEAARARQSNPTIPIVTPQNIYGGAIVDPYYQKIFKELQSGQVRDIELAREASVAYQAGQIKSPRDLVAFAERRKAEQVADENRREALLRQREVSVPSIPTKLNEPEQDVNDALYSPVPEKKKTKTQLRQEEAQKRREEKEKARLEKEKQDAIAQQNASRYNAQSKIPNNQWIPAPPPQVNPQVSWGSPPPGIPANFVNINGKWMSPAYASAVYGYKQVPTQNQGSSSTNNTPPPAVTQGNQQKPAGSPATNNTQQILNFLQQGSGNTPLGPQQANYPNWWNPALKKAQYYGFNNSPESVTTEASTGISRVSFERINQVTQATERLNLTVTKTGEVLVDTQRRWRSFFDNVGRDTVEFIKWSLAISLVLGPLQKFNELLSIAVANESKLADISVSLTGSQKSVNDVFSAASEVANQAGEEINTVLDAYETAYRAVGDTADATERFTKANKLLSDSMVLSKLTGMEEATAIDTLAAALTQSFGSEGLSRGTELLDKWVRTTKVANVSMETLATSFAVVGDAAGNAGIDADKLNGIIASIASTGVGSPKEVANTVKAIVSGVQSEQSIKALSSLGISTTDRSFTDIMDQIVAQRESGALGDEAFNKLTLAIGGGSRRQAPVSTFITEYAKVDQVYQESKKASGDAADAMAKKNDTVQTSVVKLGNAFQKLADTMGTKGGLLDDMKVLLSLGTTLVDILDALAGSAGKALPVALAAIGAGAFMFSKDSSQRGMMNLAGLASNLLPFTSNPNSSMTPQQQQELQRAQWTQQVTGGRMYKVGVGLASAAIPALSNLSDESLSNEQKALKVGADIAGGLAGSFFGGVGAMVGVSIAEGFTSAVVNEMNRDYTGTFSKVAAKLRGVDVKPEDEKLTDAQIAVKNAERTLAAVMGENSSVAEQIKNKRKTAGFEKMTDNEILQALYEDTPKVTRTTLTGARGSVDLKPALKLLIDARKALEIENMQRLGTIPESEMKAFITQNQGVISGTQENLSSTLFAQFASGQINKSRLSTGLAQTKNLGSIGSEWYKSFGQGDFGTFLGKAGRVAAYGGTEDINALNEYSAEINRQEGILRDSTKSQEEKNQALAKQNELLMVSRTLMEQLNQSILAQKNLTPETNVIGLTQAQHQLVLSEAIKESQARYAQEVKVGNMTQEEADARRKEALAFFAQTGTQEYQFVGKGVVEQSFYEDKLKQLQKEGVIPKTGAQDIGFQSFDMTSGKFQEYMKKYPSFLNTLKSMDYKPDEQTQISIFKDGIIEPMKMDWKVVQYLLQEIANNTKELTGEFNLPEGMSFYIPARAAELWKKTNETSYKGLAQPTPGMYQEEPYYGVVPFDTKKDSSLYPDQNYEMDSTGDTRLFRSDLEKFKDMEYENPVFSKLDSLASTFEQIASRPIRVDLMSTIIMKLDGKEVWEAINRQAGMVFGAAGTQYGESNFQ